MDEDQITRRQIYLKSNLLTQGCAIQPGIFFPKNIHLKKIHLYAHSDEQSEIPLPDDILIGNHNSNCIARIRFNNRSSLLLSQRDSYYFIYDKEQQEEHPIFFINNAQSSNTLVKEHKMSSICSYLGNDLVGITPSNYCFYFKDGVQCHFCEIFPTFKEQVDYKKSFKEVSIIREAVLKTLELDTHIKHLAFTTGNIKSYDFTAQYFCEIGDAIQIAPSFHRLNHILATLMPPDDFSIISKIKSSGFNKIYFPLEVFEKAHFLRVCPGKGEYGYEKMLDALNCAVGIFGVGNVYTNFVYGIQSLNTELDPISYDPVRENEKCQFACQKMLENKIIPAFTLYHYAGYNKIGKIHLDHEKTLQFFINWGNWVYQSKIVPEKEKSVIFSSKTLSNTLYNDGFLLAKNQKV